ncbi:MAG: sensor histidine kinase CpxA [Verrucomicrobia bacterium]|nr:MAG: sensor histidine kinase CpxA [Verrucomicrobiota bacterium]
MAFERMAQAVEPLALVGGTGTPFKAGDAVSNLEQWIYLQKERLELSEEKNRLLIADVAHELCSPLARMQRALSLAERHIGADALPYMQKVENELQHVARLVEEVLSFSKTTAQPAGEPADRFLLVDLVEEVLTREASTVELQTRIPEDLVLTTRRNTLDRALSNLVRNAVRYAADAGPIEICAEVTTDWVTLCVRDSGPGLPPELLEKIFQPFYRPDFARQRRTGGAGLGLAIVRSCAEACGGSVHAQLRTPRGLEFQIRLPHVNESQTAAPGAAQADASGG